MAKQKSKKPKAKRNEKSHVILKKQDEPIIAELLERITALEAEVATLKAK